VTYTRGAPRTDNDRGNPIPAEVLPGGVDGEFFLGEALGGAPIYKAHTDQIDFDWGNGSPSPQVPADGFSARWTAALVPKTTGDYQLGTRTDDGSRLWIDDRQVVDDWTVHPARSATAPVHLVAGHSYRIRMEYFEHNGEASARLVWSPPVGHNYEEAVQAAKAANAIVLVLGLSGELENEENDRKDITLPAPQEGLLKAVLDTGKPVVVVLLSGSCLAVDDSRIRGLIQAWYPGEEGGAAVADVLFGHISPGGRLPVTFYRSLEQVPPFRDYKMDGRTYRYLHSKPLYPFGYGLSYTKFAYRDARCDGHSVSVTVCNTGEMEGDEVVQVYASRAGAEWPEPSRKLVAFKRIHLRAGQSEAVGLLIDRRALAQADGEGNLTILGGTYTISVGGGLPGEEPATSGKDATVGLTLTASKIGR
jgi:beta-glucosidase